MRSWLLIALCATTQIACATSRRVVRHVGPGVMHDMTTPSRDPDPFAVPWQHVTAAPPQPEGGAGPADPGALSPEVERALAVLLAVVFGGRLPVLEIRFSFD